MPISFSRLNTVLESKGLNKFYLRKNGINPNMLNQILTTGNTGTKTIEKICALLNCQPGDIMEFVPDKETGDTK
ncbi:helix-turn-helix transcriptional regulator [Oscillospiraceae bacterium MB08-C2-2]|nr:helix-turn-helix transcriptional regulator [Oscillospiraceae bacterium MB08-C2-2]